MGFNRSITKAPAPKRYGRISEISTAITFLTGRKIYQEHKTKKKKKPASPDSLVNDNESLFKELLIELIEKDIS